MQSLFLLPLSSFPLGQFAFSSPAELRLDWLTEGLLEVYNYEFLRKRQNGGWKVSDADWFYFSFYDPSWLFYDPSWSEPNFILFFTRSELIRSDFCTCLAKMFVCPVPKISHVMMKWCRRASHLGRFTLWNNGRRATQLSRFTLWHNRRWASQLAGKFTLWHNGRRAKQPGLMHASGVARIFQRKIWRLNPK